MKLVGILTRKENMWVIQIPKLILRVAELNGVRIASKVRIRLRLYRDTGEPIDTDAKVQIYGRTLDNCYLIIPAHVAQSIRGSSPREEVVFEIVEETSSAQTVETTEEESQSTSSTG